MTKGVKDMCRSIFLTLLIPLLGWATWVTAQTYSSQHTKQALVEYKAQVNEQRQEIKQELNSLQNEVHENHQTIYKILLDLQKQLSGMDIIQKK